MNAQQKAPAMDYPQYWGTKLPIIAEVAGAKSYATGGQTIAASDLGLGGFDFVDPGQALSYSGTYYCRVQYLPISAAASKQKPGITSVKLLWYVLATNAEVGAAVDISGEIVRVLFVGVP